ncbi:MAG: small metal-binding protein SmbP [Methylococcales bacterium]|nr:small metal-binding protein SmbP [Methylococcales bacterium]
MNMKLTGLFVGIALSLGSFSTYAAESHITQAIAHAEAATKAADGKAIAEHAEASKTHAKVADEHLDAGVKSLDSAIEHGKLGHSDVAKKAAEEALVHLKAAQ